MNFEAVKWAMSQKVGGSAAKSVLSALACRANSKLEAYPSIQQICEDTELNRKTIINALTLLLEKGYISDTGDRVGKTHQVIKYKLKLERVKESQNRDCYTGAKDTENGTLSDENEQKRDETVPILRETVPNSVHVNNTEIINNNTPPIAPPECEDDSPETKLTSEEIEGDNFGDIGVEPTEPDKPDPIEDEFKKIWAIYPKRKGGNPRAAALSSYRARRDEGNEFPELLLQVERYAEFSKAEGKINTPYVMQCSSFFGPQSEGYKQDWSIDKQAQPFQGRRYVSQSDINSASNMVGRVNGAVI